MDTLISYVVGAAQGRAIIRSMKGRVLFQRSRDGAIEHRRKELTTAYPGTMVEILFNPAALEKMEEGDEFEW